MSLPPVEYEMITAYHAKFAGRSYYGPHAADRAELDYLRAWKRWAEDQLAAATKFIEELTDGRRV